MESTKAATEMASAYQMSTRGMVANPSRRKREFMRTVFPLSGQAQRYQLGWLVGPTGGDGDVLLAASHIGDGLARGVAR